MVRGRPYRMLRIDELTGKVRKSPSDGVLLDEVAAELEHRKTNKARKLAQEVSRLRGRAKAPEEGASSGPGRERTPAAIGLPPSRAGQAEEVADSRARDALLQTRYRALRETFTAEAEILSRWGLTSLAPAPLRQAAIGYWRRALASSERHPLGLSSKDLEQDLAALEKEAQGRAG